jgi:uncharacterized protein (TIGR02246 family)
MKMVKKENDQALIEALWKEYASAMIAGDIDRWLELWIFEGKQMPPGAPARIGIDEIRAGNEPTFDLFNWHIAIFPSEIRIINDHAYSHGEYEYALTPKEGGEKISGTGKFLTILARQTNGTWKIAVDCFNDNAPPDAF